MMNLDVESIVRKLNSSQGKLDGLNELAEALNVGCSTATFLGQLEKLFSGLRSALQVDPNQSEILIKANQVILDMLPDIQHSDDLEIQFAQLMPMLIENLGNAKAVVRKSTHKCIATYVKISKKLEYVLLHIVHTGLENSITRTRQHSMLVIPALISLKPQILDKSAPEAVDMLVKILKRLRDSQEIVAKTSRKLLLELYKCYPYQMENNLMSALKTEEEKIICKAVFRNDEDEINRLLAQVNTQSNSQTNKKNFQEETKQTSSYSQSNNAISQSQLMNKSSNPIQNAGKELSIIGKEILQSSNNNNNIATSQIGSLQVIDKIIYEAKEESRYPKAQNNLYFGFLEESMIEALNENNQWKERTNAIEAIESKLNIALLGDKKMEFLPYATPFLGFMMQYIPDINFKISLTTIKIISKLLQMNLINFKKYYQQLVTSLVEKLSDSKVVIRQAVLKCCSFLITMSSGNQNQQQIPQTPDQDTPLPLNPSLIQEICSLFQSEDKQKIQQYIIDILALAIEKSPEKQKTQLIIQRSLGLSQTFKTNEDVLLSQITSKDFFAYKQIVERLLRGNLPFINEENIVEFPLPAVTNVVQATPKTYQIPQFGSSFKQESNNSDYGEIAQQETLASNMTKLPSQTFMENKRKLEEEKKMQQKQVEFSRISSQEKEPLRIQKNEQPIEKNPEKIAMWLPTFSHTNSEQLPEKSEQMGQFSKNLRMSQNMQNKKTEQFNVTASSVATFIDDGKSNVTATTMQSFNNQITLSDNKNALNSYGQVPQPQYMKSPIFSDNNQSSLMNNDQGSHRQYGQTQMSSNSNQMQNSNYNSNLGNAIMRQGYTPEQHASKPRNIQSNELRQRTVDGFPYNNSTYSKLNDSDANDADLQYELQISTNLQKNMSHSTGGVGGFGVNHNKGPQVTDRLKLLKTNSKYKPTNNSSSADKRRDPYDKFDDQESISFNNDVTQKLKNINNNNTGFNQKQFGVQGGPIKANHQEDYLQTINNEDFSDNNPNITPNIMKTKKPPLTTKPSAAQSKAQSRAQSVDNSEQPLIENSGDIYQLIEEPLKNPEQQLKLALDLFKSGDWSKQFEGCNIMKRAIMFHKQLLSAGNPLQPQLIKELLKIVDSLRSQLAKNAILTINMMLESIPAREIDPQIDSILPALLKKGADTNAFISGAADQALISLCLNLTDIKVFNALQSQTNIKSNPMKLQVIKCYNTLIEKLGAKIRQFSQIERLVQIIATFMNEGAIEVRNMAKIGLYNLKTAVGSQRELESLLNRCVQNEKQLEKIKQIIDKNDFESISNNGSTRYGTSMRNSSLDSKSAGPYRNQPPAAGSDGFGKFTATSDFNNMQNTFMKGSGGITVGGAQGFSATANAFKKQNNASLSKPIDPVLMEEFRNLMTDLGTNDWNKRIKTIENLTEFVKNNQSTIKSAQPAKFIQLIDGYCKVLNDNNAKVLAQAQQSFRIILLNQNLKPLIEQNLTMIVQALTTNLQSTNYQAKEQGDLLFTLLDGAVDSNLLIPPIVAQINLANNKQKAALIEKISNLIERVDKVSLIQKYVCPLLQSNNKIQAEASTNAQLKAALQRLQTNTNRIIQMSQND